jgi:Rps23 Pro-64 3,4-dihydroxylase Tpa1-like proline 4-hydroxylase
MAAGVVSFIGCYFDVKTLKSATKEADERPFSISQIESQMTSHNDGNYYKIHNDNGSPDTATRELTYVQRSHIALLKLNKTIEVWF